MYAEVRLITKRRVFVSDFTIIFERTYAFCHALATFEAAVWHGDSVQWRRHRSEAMRCAVISKDIWNSNEMTLIMLWVLVIKMCGLKHKVKSFLERLSIRNNESARPFGEEQAVIKRGKEQ